MNIVLNGERRDALAGLTVAALVAEMGCSSKGMAVAVNEELVPKSTWLDVELRPGDRVEVLRASQGG